MEIQAPKGAKLGPDLMPLLPKAAALLTFKPAESLECLLPGTKKRKHKDPLDNCLLLTSQRLVLVVNHELSQVFPLQELAIAQYVAKQGMILTKSDGTVSVVPVHKEVGAYLEDRLNHMFRQQRRARPTVVVSPTEQRLDELSNLPASVHAEGAELSKVLAKLQGNARLIFQDNEQLLFHAPAPGMKHTSTSNCVMITTTRLIEIKDKVTSAVDLLSLARVTVVDPNPEDGTHQRHHRHHHHRFLPHAPRLPHLHPVTHTAVSVRLLNGRVLVLDRLNSEQALFLAQALSQRIKTRVDLAREKPQKTVARVSDFCDSANFYLISEFAPRGLHGEALCATNRPSTSPGACPGTMELVLAAVTGDNAQKWTIVETPNGRRIVPVPMADYMRKRNRFVNVPAGDKVAAWVGKMEWERDYRGHVKDKGSNLYLSLNPTCCGDVDCERGRMGSGLVLAMWAASEVHPMSDQETERINTLREGLQVKDRVVRGTTHANCFVGKEAIKFLLDKRLMKNIRSALAWMESLLRIGVIAHVAGKHKFKNTDHLYRFVAHVAAGSKTVPGLLQRWRFVTDFELFMNELVVPVLHQLTVYRSLKAEMPELEHNREFNAAVANLDKDTLSSVLGQYPARFVDLAHTAQLGQHLTLLKLVILRHSFDRAPGKRVRIDRDLEELMEAINTPSNETRLTLPGPQEALSAWQGFEDTLTEYLVLKLREAIRLRAGLGEMCLAAKLTQLWGDAHSPLRVYRADAEPNRVWMGDCIQGPLESAKAVPTFPDHPELFRAPVSLELACVYHGTGALVPLHVWMPVAPSADFVALGCVVSNGASPPDVPMLRCVKRSCLIVDKQGVQQFYTFQDHSESEVQAPHYSLWRLSDLGTFVVGTGHTAPVRGDDCLRFPYRKEEMEASKAKLESTGIVLLKEASVQLKNITRQAVQDLSAGKPYGTTDRQRFRYEEMADLIQATADFLDHDEQEDVSTATQREVVQRVRTEIADGKTVLKKYLYLRIRKLVHKKRKGTPQEVYRQLVEAWTREMSAAWCVLELLPELEWSDIVAFNFSFTPSDTERQGWKAMLASPPLVWRGQNMRLHQLLFAELQPLIDTRFVDIITDLNAELGKQEGESCDADDELPMLCFDDFLDNGTPESTAPPGSPKAPPRKHLTNKAVNTILKAYDTSLADLQVVLDANEPEPPEAALTSRFADCCHVLLYEELVSRLPIALLGVSGAVKCVKFTQRYERKLRTAFTREVDKHRLKEVTADTAALVNEYMDVYDEQSKLKVMEWVENTIMLERTQATLYQDEDDFYYTDAPMNLFTHLHNAYELAVREFDSIHHDLAAAHEDDTLTGIALLRVAMMYVHVLLYYPSVPSRTMQNATLTGTPLDILSPDTTEFVIFGTQPLPHTWVLAQANNVSRFQEQTARFQEDVIAELNKQENLEEETVQVVEDLFERVSDGFFNMGVRCMDLLLQLFGKYCPVAVSPCFTARWLAEHDTAFDSVSDTLTAMYRHFAARVERDAFTRSLVKRSLRVLVSHYVHAFVHKMLLAKDGYHAVDQATLWKRIEADRVGFVAFCDQFHEEVSETIIITEFGHISLLQKLLETNPDDKNMFDMYAIKLVDRFEGDVTIAAEDILTAVLTHNTTTKQRVAEILSRWQPVVEEEEVPKGLISTVRRITRHRLSIRPKSPTQSGSSPPSSPKPVHMMIAEDTVQKLFVHVVAANGLTPKHAKDPDPVCTVHLMAESGELLWKDKTHQEKKTLNPQWDSTWDAFDQATLSSLHSVWFEVRHARSLVKPKFMGEAVLHIEEVRKAHLVRGHAAAVIMELPLRPRARKATDKVTGSLQIQISFCTDNAEEEEVEAIGDKLLSSLKPSKLDRHYSDGVKELLEAKYSNGRAARPMRRAHSPQQGFAASYESARHKFRELRHQAAVQKLLDLKAARRIKETRAKGVTTSSSPQPTSRSQAMRRIRQRK